MRSSSRRFLHCSLLRCLCSVVCVCFFCGEESGEVQNGCRGSPVHLLLELPGISRDTGTLHLWSNQQPFLRGSSFVLPRDWGSLLIWISSPPYLMTSPPSFKICVGASSAKPNQQYKFASSRIGSKMQVWGREEPVESGRGVKGIQTPRSPSLLPVSWRGLERGPLVNHWVIYRLILMPPPKNEWIPSQHAPGRVFL